jgi:cysteine-rich repeat protein
MRSIHRASLRSPSPFSSLSLPRAALLIPFALLGGCAGPLDPGGEPVLSSGLAAGAATPNTVLILETSVVGGYSSLEAETAAALGFDVEVASAADWAAKSTADFNTYRAIVLGDPSCGGLSSIAAAEANAATWGPAVEGNVVVVGTDPKYHAGIGGAQLTEGAIKFAAAEPGATGAYISLSCYYSGVLVSTPVPVLAPFGSFMVRGSGGYNDAHKVADHPALAGITDAVLSNWNASIHNVFDSFPASFIPLAIAENVADPSALKFPDGSWGVPYILAFGAEAKLCGNSVLDPGEQCDDGNYVSGDGCSEACQLEGLDACGDGVVGAGEQCDDGGNAPGDGCSDTCQFEYPGACCLPLGCADLTFSGDCALKGGEFFGAGATCEEIGDKCGPPPQPGACCLGDGCAELTEGQCADSGGDYAGEGTLCGEDTCPGCTEPTGACCVGGLCLVLTAVDCFKNDGLYAGDESICTSETCESCDDGCGDCDGGCGDGCASGCSASPPRGGSPGAPIGIAALAIVGIALASRRGAIRSRRADSR